MSDSTFGTAFVAGQRHGMVGMQAELSGQPARDDAGFGRSAPAGWWIAVVVMGGAVGWLGFLSVLIG